MGLFCFCVVCSTVLHCLQNFINPFSFQDVLILCSLKTSPLFLFLSLYMEAFARAGLSLNFCFKCSDETVVLVRFQ